MGLPERIPQVILNWESDEGCNKLDLVTCSRWRECNYVLVKEFPCCLKITLECVHVHKRSYLKLHTSPTTTHNESQRVTTSQN